MIDLTGIEPSLDKALELFPPTLYGNTWIKGEDGNYILPEYTLGYECLAWSYQWCINPQTGGPWMFSAEQARFILWYYAIDPETGLFVNRKGVLQRPKGWGKDPLAAILCLFELCGDCRFDYWDENHLPVAKNQPEAKVLLIANSRNQNKNTFDMIVNVMPLHSRQALNIEVNATSVKVKNSTRSIEMMSTARDQMEGIRPTFQIGNEIQYWTPSKGRDKVHEVVTKNNGKIDNSHILYITNAPVPGSDSTGERLRRAQDLQRAGQAVEQGWYYDSIEAHSDAPADWDWSLFILKMVYGDSYWVNLEQIRTELFDVSSPASENLRMYYNVLITSEDSIYSPGEWDGIEDFDKKLVPGDKIVIGFDGGKSDDSTALVAIRLEDRCIFTLGVWSKPEGAAGRNWQVNKQQVESTIQEAFNDYTVLAFYADVELWESYINEWSEKYKDRLMVKASTESTVGFDMRGNIKRSTHAHEALYSAVQEEKVATDGNPILRMHALHAHRRVNNFGMSFGKESRESPKKVDAYAATVIAFLALTELLEKGKVPDNRSRRLIRF